MRVISIQAEQGHAVPKQVLAARGPFAPYTPPKAVQEYQQEFPLGATAQNGMRGVVFYECRLCAAVVREDDIDNHECKE